MAVIIVPSVNEKYGILEQNFGPVPARDLLCRHAIKPRSRRRIGVRDLQEAAAAGVNRLPRLPHHGRHEIRRVLDRIICVRLAGELKFKAVGQQHRRLQLRRIQRLHKDDHIGGNAGGIVIVERRVSDGVNTGIGPFVSNRHAGIGGHLPIAKRPSDARRSSGEHS